MHQIQNLLFIVQIIITAVLTILSVIPTHPKLTKVYPFYRKVMKALDKLVSLKNESFQIENKMYNLKVGRLKREDQGFKELLLAIKSRYSWLKNKNISEILLLWGNKLPLKTTMITPNAAIFILSSENDKQVLQPIIFYAFSPQITLELRDIKTWVKEIANSRIARYIIALTMIWVMPAFLQLILG